MPNETIRRRLIQRVGMFQLHVKITGADWHAPPAGPAGSAELCDA